MVTLDTVKKVKIALHCIRTFALAVSNVVSLPRQELITYS
jgi:hypothetical protein